MNDNVSDLVFQQLCEDHVDSIEQLAAIISSSCLLEEMEKLNVTYTSSDSYAKDVESDSNLYLNDMFSKKLAIDSIIEKLARFKESSEGRERFVFGCIIATVFEEYKFFSKYPYMQLKIAAVVLGSLIKHRLIAHLTLGIALRYVLDALRKPTDSKMFGLGIEALEQFLERLIEWPQYCNLILRTSHLRATRPDLMKSVEDAANKISSAFAATDADYHNISDFKDGLIQSSAAYMEPQSRVGVPSVSTSPSVPSSSQAPSTRFGTANIQTLVAAERRETLLKAPDSEFQADMTRIINNLSPNNIDDKAKQFVAIMKNQQYSPWIAQYIVGRIGVEANFHDLYLKFLDKLDLKSLNREIVKATYEKCKVLLKSNLIKSSGEERLMLKNLGSWLGKITIGKNKVLRGREIDPKSLVIEAYEKGLMIAMVPFTSKILESCSNSVAYQPPNPWTVGILGLLAEIHDMPNLKMNLKIGIDVLLKNLGSDLKDVTGPSLLKDRVREVEGNPDFSHIDYGSYQLKKERISTPSKVEANIEPQGVVNNNLQPSILDLHFQSSLPLAMKIAIEEISVKIVTPCVSIATQTTKKLVLKDFSMETDETIICHAAKLMVARLAGRLAYARCKEPLRRSLSGLEQAVGLVTNDNNLEHGCALIEQAAVEQAVETIDGEILHELRTRHRGPTPGQLLRLYEEFARSPTQTP